jgi:hypothetical protein
MRTPLPEFLDILWRFARRRKWQSSNDDSAEPTADLSRTLILNLMKQLPKAEL